MPTLIRTLRALSSLVGLVDRLLGAPRPPGGTDPRADRLVAAAAQARSDGRSAEAMSLYRQALRHDRFHVWPEAAEPARRLVALVPPADRARESEWLAVIHYEIGQARMAAGLPKPAAAEFRSAIRANRSFVPATIALGDAYEAAGDRWGALRVWERAAEVTPALPILARLEQVYRREGRPTRMIALYQEALERAPDDIALALALGRVYFELEMLDEAADHFEKLEVRVPDLPAVHAFLGAIFERRAQTREAFGEYRQALQLAHAFAAPCRCAACGATAPMWQARCPACGRWNSLRS
jgi:tetratricopeptide (TPR) repeat protein